MDEAVDKQGPDGGPSATPAAPTIPAPTTTAPQVTVSPAGAGAANASTSQFVAFEEEDKYEREDVQKKTFAKWINSQLVKGQHPPVTDLFYDLRDGTRLLALLEVLTNKTYKREKGRMRVHHLNNVSRALGILEEHSVKLVNISNEHIVDGSAKLTLGLVWAIILHWQVQGVLKDVMSDLQQTNLEKTLLAWCRQTTKGYHGVDVRNFTTSWTDGLAFNALIHSQRPQLFDWTVLARKHPYARLENAFRLANEHLNIERLLDPEDVNSQVPDKKSIMMYVMCLFQALPHESFTMESLDVSVQSDSSFSIEGSSEDILRSATKGRPLSTASIGLSEYQRTLEEVLTWLLGAEDRLAAMPPIADTTDEVKDQFHELEELMLELTSKQGGIGDVLGEGSRLMRDGVMEEEEEEEVRVQMKLLNTRWEELRVKAMDRQSRLHEKLMSLQQKQLESLKKWLTDTEDRIANMSQVGPTTEALRQQISGHQNLQQDLENEQSNINSLSNMVVVVDESNSDSAYSTLEDELNALGERWAHICRWAESRWTTLQTLSVHWEHFEQEMEKLRHWMDEKEALLRQVESNPSTEQEHILKHASMLQVLQAEMAVQHRRFDYLQEECAKILSNIPQESPAHENLSLEVETLQDRMDCLVSIIEAQTQRMAASGIDITKVTVPVDDSGDVVSSSTTTISHEGATVVTKIITTKVTEMVKGSVVKRQKLEGSSQEDFSVALHQLGGWMDSMEAQVKPKAMEELSLEQLNQLCQQLESEMEAQKEEYYKVVSLGQSAISETSTIGESAKESEQQVALVVSRWEALTEMLIEIRTRITYLTEKKKVTTELSDLEVHYQGFLRWFEDVRTVSENEPNAVKLQLEQCKTKTSAMKSHDEQITVLKASAEALDTKWTQETQSVLQEIETFHTKWGILMQRFLEWNETLKEEEVQAAPSSLAMPRAPPPESLLKAMEASGRWLESLEAALASEFSVSTLPQMQDHLNKFKDLSEKVEMEKGNMAHINEKCNKLSQDGHVNLMEDITKLNKQWETTTQALQSRIKNIEKVIEKQKQYNDEVSGLKSWLAEVDIFLQAEEAALGDIDTLEAQLEQSNALQDDVATLQNNVTSIKTTGKQLIEEGDSELKSIIQGQLEELVKRWDLVTELARAQNKSLKEALARSQKVHDDIDKLNVWLDELEPKVPSVISTQAPEELGNALKLFTQLREEISTRSGDLRALNNIGDEMLQHDSVATHEDLARQFTQLNGRWTEVVAQVDSKYKLLVTAAQQYEDFKKLCSEESEWLDQLQAKLERSSKDAADAEEISEALDELEIFLHSHDESRLEQIRSLAESLVREGCVAESVQETTCSLTSRFDTLNAQASEQQSGLEGSVQEAQAWEREYVSVLDYLAQSDLILNQAIADQIQVDQVQVQAELLTQQDVLKKMQRQVEVYHSQGKTEAALRLEDQISHLQRKYEDIEMKLRVCQKPCDFDTRLSQMSQQLGEISQRVHLVNLGSGEPDGIQEQLNQCMDLYQTLSEIKAEVENVIATGRKIVKEGQSSDPDDLTLQLDQLKALYNQLGGAVTEQRGVLERALRHSRKIQKDSSHLEEWLSTTECELDQHEATVPTKNVQGEVHFAQAEQVAKETEMERFIIGLGEIKGWLESTEYQLANISKLHPNEHDKLVKDISLEMQNYKGQIENIRDTATHLINHGVLFQARIQPELLLINQRWENIYKIMQVTSACEIDSSSLASVSRSSAGQTSGFPVSPLSSPEYVRTRQYSTESSQSFHTVENSNASADSIPVVTHMASGMSSSMLDFFSRHNVLIIDPDAKEKETLSQPSIMPPHEQNLEMNLGNKGVDSLGINKCEGPVLSSSPITFQSSEIAQDMDAMRATVEQLSIPVTSSSSVSMIETSNVTCYMSTSNGDDAQGHIHVNSNISEVERLISTASVENEAMPFEMTMELAHERLPFESENMVRNAIEVPTETGMNALVMQVPSVLYSNSELNITQHIEESAAEKITDKNDIRIGISNPLVGASKDSNTTAYHTEVIQAADIESGSVIEVLYQVGEPKERKQIAPITPKESDQNTTLEDKEMDKEKPLCHGNVSFSPTASNTVVKESFSNFANRKIMLLSGKEGKVSTASQSILFAPQEVVSSNSTPPTPSKSFLSSQDVPCAVEENPRISAVTAKVVYTKESDSAFLKQTEDSSNNVSTTPVVIQPGEMAVGFDMPSPYTSSFAFEQQTSVPLQVQYTDNVVTTQNVQVTDCKVCIENPDPNRVTDFAGDEAPDVLDISSLPIQSFAAEKQATLNAQRFTDDIVTSENVPVTAVGDRDSIKRDQKISTASREYDFVPQEVVSAIPTPLFHVEAFTFPHEMSVTLEQNLKPRAVLTEIVQMKDSGYDNSKVMKENLDIIANTSSPRINTGVSESERKISGAMRNVEIKSQDITESLGREGVNVPEFAMERSVSGRTMDSLKEAVLVAPEVVFQGTLRCNGNERPVEKYEIHADHPFEGISKKMSIASVDMEMSYTEMLLEQEQALCPERFTCTSEVSAGASEGCSEEVVVTTVNAINTGTETRELSSPEVNGQIPMDIEVISEVSEEGIPLGCEAAMIDPSVTSGYEIKSQSGQGSDFGELAADEIDFIRGVKSAIPSGYIFTTNTVEDDSMSEALSYFDIETSVDVQDRYGVAVTVIGTRNDLNMSIEDTEEKRFPHEEGGMEELKIESSFDSLLKSSQLSPKDISFSGLPAGKKHKYIRNDKYDVNEKKIEFIKDKSGNRSTFLTEVASLTDNEYSDTLDEQSQASTLQTVNQSNILRTEEIYEVDRIAGNIDVNLLCDTGVAVPCVSQSYVQDEEVERVEDTGQPFGAVQQSQKLTPLHPLTKLEDQIPGSESGSVAVVHEASTRKEQEAKSGEFVQPDVFEQGKDLVIQSVASVQLESLTRSKSSSNSTETAVCYVPHVPLATDKGLQLASTNTQDVPPVSSDSSTVFQQEIINVSEEQISSSVMKHATTVVRTPLTETTKSTLKDIEVEIHDIPLLPADTSKNIPEKDLAKVIEIPSTISPSKQEASDISTTVHSKDTEVHGKDNESMEASRRGGGPTVTKLQCKSVEVEMTGHKSDAMKRGDDQDTRSKIHYVPHVPVSVAISSANLTSPSTLPQGQTKRNVIFKRKDLCPIKETDITSDDEKFESASNEKMETHNKKAQDLRIHYVPHVSSGVQQWDQGGLKKEAKPENLSMFCKKQKDFITEENVPDLKPDIQEESAVIEPKVQTSSQKTEGIIEAQVHIPVSESKDTISSTKKESRVHEKERRESYEIHYVPYSLVEFPKSGSGARPKEIHYVPHSPADLKTFECEERNAKPLAIPSVIITSPSTSKLDAVVASSPDIMKNLKQTPTGGSVAGVADSRSSASETVFASRSFVKESTQEQIHITTTVTSSEDTQKIGDEVDAFLQEVTRMADKITAVKTKVQTAASYEEAKEKVEALEQEVALLEPDVATVISHGDTLTLTTHMVDVPRANTIRIAVNDLRTHWSSLKSETENVKLETEEVTQEIGTISERADEIIGWSNDVLKRLHLVNNDESQLEALENEMTSKKAELDKLNETGALLKKYKYNQIQPVLTLLNMRWTEISMQFRQYRKVSLEKKTIVATTKVETETEPIIVPDFVASVNRLREAISTISRQLNASKLAGNKYDNLKAQEDELKVIKQGLETLKPRVDGLETERNATIKNVTPAESEQVRRVMDKLREEWAQVNRGYTERHARWLQCSETWRTLQKTIDDFAVWLNSIEERVHVTANQALPDAKSTQKELEKQVTLKHRPSQTLQSMCKEVTEGMSADDGKRLQERVDSLMKRWRALLLDLAARRERIAGEEGGKDSTCSEYETLVTWVDQAQALMDAPVNVTDEASLSAHSTMVQNHLVDMTTKQNLLKKLKDSKPKPVSTAQMTSLETNLNKVIKSLPDYKNMVDTKLGVIKTLVADVEGLYKWTEEMRVKVALRNLTEEEIKLSKITLREKEALYENLDSTYWVLAQDAEGKGLTVAVALKNRMNTIESRLKALQGQIPEAGAAAAAAATVAPPSPTSPAFPAPDVAGDEEKVDQEKVVKLAKEEKVAASKMEASLHATGTTVTSSVTSVIQNVIKFEESVLSTEGEMRPPSPLLCPPKHAPDSSPALILASLDKSILQIRDWLTLMEQMTRQQSVVVGDAEDIRQLTEKQKSVLRELEGKKPQLDELVASADSLKDDASRTQLHQKATEGDAAVYKFPTHSRLFDHLRTCFKVSKLREHWDETNSVVLARKTQLDAMYADTHKFDAKRAELETWLGRMEARLERMAPVARTADVLDQQIREQKGFHAEIHQYKHQVELFNQMTQRLIAIYQHDDTRRLKKITETINLRYSSLNSSIIARGKELHSAMNSLHNFDKALDKFASWMSEAESNTDLVEMEVDKLGPARRDPQARAPAMHLKDLQSEIESHKDVLASLNATGQKLLGTLENQDEAVMLQRRLEEMNQRWNTLKHKSIAIRNRLEGNSENWNTLLLSLRELIEWVIRKDTELTALGPLVGELNSLSKFSEDLSSFRRVIDEKQPVIESNLKSGRQLIASEPPLSDTSDSEAGRELDGDARYRGDDSARDLTRSVRREVAKLSEKWAALRERAAGAAAQADLAHKKLGVLQKTVEEVSGRLEEAEKTVDSWGPVPQDSNLADQHAHNVRKFREGLAELQRGVDDVNDQAARFSAHNVPLTPANSAKLHDLNNRWKTLETAVNDRWRQVAGRSREVTPLTPAQLASSVSPPWERATTSNKVPYYINHDQESTHWDHPIMMDLLDSLTEFNHIKFSAYRTATKLRMLQKKLALDRAKMQMATDIFDEHGLRGQNDRLIDVGDMVVVLSALYANIAADHPEVNTTLAMDLCLNWLLNVYDSQRTGQMRVLSFKIGLVCLCTGHLEEKYRYMFRLIADPNRLADQRKLGLLLHDCVQVPRQLGEVAAFGGSNIEPSVRSCFTKAGKDRETVEAVHFLTWVQQEPQSLVWLAVLHRVAASENIQHQVKCNICKAYPIVGLRYRCLKCLSFDMCQRCFFDGRSGKSHKITHPMHEYCTATTAGEDVKDFTKALKNKFKSKRSLQKHTKKGYLPVQTVLEGDPLESPSPSPQHNVTSQDMHSRLELYASRLAEVELRTNSNSTPDSEDEHGLIAQYCQSLSSSDAPLPVPRSPLQIMAAVDAEQKDELEQMIRALEEENSVLQAEYDRLKSQQPVGSPPDDGLTSQRSEADMLAEAKLLRQHKGRLEARMGILEEHNRQLEAQLHRLRQLLGEAGGTSSPNKSGTLQTKSVTASQLAMDSPAKVNGHSSQGGATSAYDGLEQMSEYVRPPPPPMGSVAHVGNLFSRAGDLGKAVGTLVATMTHEGESDLPSDEEGDSTASDTEEDKAV